MIDLVALIGPVYLPQRAIWMSWYGMVDWQGETGDMLLTPVRPNGWHDGGIYILQARPETVKSRQSGSTRASGRYSASSLRRA